MTTHPLDLHHLRGLYQAGVALLTARGYRVRKILDSVSEWQAAGLPVEGPGASTP